MTAKVGIAATANSRIVTGRPERIGDQLPRMRASVLPSSTKVFVSMSTPFDHGQSECSGRCRSDNRMAPGRNMSSTRAASTESPHHFSPTTKPAENCRSARGHQSPVVRRQVVIIKKQHSRPSMGPGRRSTAIKPVETIRGKVLSPKAS